MLVFFSFINPLYLDLGVTLLPSCIKKVLGPSSSLNKDSHVLASELWFLVASLGFSQTEHNFGTTLRAPVTHENSDPGDKGVPEGYPTTVDT